jgi:hypothetical protein
VPDLVKDVHNAGALSSALIDMLAPATTLSEAIDRALEALNRGAGKTDEEIEFLMSLESALRSLRAQLECVVHVAEFGGAWRESLPTVVADRSGIRH